MENDKLYMGGETQEISKEDKKKLNIEKQNEELFNLENEINKIYNELNENKDFSLYRISYLLKRIQLMQIRIREIIGSDTYKDVSQRYKMITMKIASLLIIGLPLMSILPYLSLIICAIMIGLDLKFIKDSRNLQTKYLNNSNEVIARLNSINNTTINCNELIREKVRIMENKSKESLNAQQEDKFIIANNIIVDLVNKEKSKYIDESLSQEVCDIIRRILQDDLNTTETNLSILIDMAREKINTENMTNEFGIKRKVLESEL